MPIQTSIHNNWQFLQRKSSHQNTLQKQLIKRIDKSVVLTETRYPIKLGSYVENVIIIAEGAGIRTVEKLRIENPLPNGELTNVEDWKKVVGNAILIDNGEERKAEIHWYQCDGIGKRRLKVKRWKKSK